VGQTERDVHRVAIHFCSLRSPPASPPAGRERRKQVRTTTRHAAVIGAGTMMHGLSQRQAPELSRLSHRLLPRSAGTTVDRSNEDPARFTCMAPRPTAIALRGMVVEVSDAR
jgi:hypothetical protein